jgi:penicillin-insensitive murein DD-endopeptidase
MDERKQAASTVWCASSAGRLFVWSAIFLLAAVPGCTGIFSRGPGGSLSWGSHSQGALLGASSLPFEGAGYQVHPDWRIRGRSFAVDELVRGLSHTFAQVEQSFPGSVAHVGDLSVRRGGDSSMHRSHESGRDVDVFYYAADREGRPLTDLPAMLRFAGDGSVVGWSGSKPGKHPHESLPDVQFDRRRNWALVAALLSESSIEVQWIFIHQPLADLLLQEAEQEKADPALLARAREILHQPTDSRPHDDHMHVRVFCPVPDRMFGCFDKGPRRWWKKRWKYMGRGALVADR